MNRQALPLFAAIVMLAASAFAQTSPVPGVRVWSGSSSTRIAIDMTGEFAWSADRAINPDRLFFDVRGSRPAFFTRGEQAIPIGDQLIRRIRVARWQPAVFRIVLDVAQSVEYEVSKLASPDRMIVEIRPAGAPLPAPVVPDIPAATVPELQPSAASRTVRPRGARIFAPPQRLSRRYVPQPLYFPPPVLYPATVTVALAGDPTKPRERAGRSLPGASPAFVGDGPVSLTRALGLKVGRIVIDAGHGGHDTGTVGRGGMLEKDLVLDVAQRLGELVTRRLGAEVIFTRSDDTFIPLEDRTRIANDRRADLFLSVHANSSPSSAASGIETYYLNFTTNQPALEVAARENAASGHTVHDLGSLVQLIAKNDKVEESRQFATRVQHSLWAFSVRGNAASKDRGIKKAPFVVLIGARMPSVLCEIGFLSNPKDEAMLKRPEYRQKLAEALYRGLAGYASTLSHIQVASTRD